MTEAEKPMKDRVLVEVTAPAPADAVWEALREPAKIKQWFGWEADSLDDEFDYIFVANAVVGYVGGLYSSLPTTTFWLIHVASAAFGLVAFVLFKIVLGKRISTGTREQAEALS